MIEEDPELIDAMKIDQQPVNHPPTLVHSNQVPERYLSPSDLAAVRYLSNLFTRARLAD